MNKIQIGPKRIGDGESVFIIAEIGSNHDQKMAQAKKLIDAAVDAKADAVKFQLFKTECLYSTKDPMYPIFKSCELPFEWVRKLAVYARKRKVVFLASAFDPLSIDKLCEINVPAIKWASSETTNLRLLRYAASKGKPMLISTGMCDTADIHEAIQITKSTGNDQIALLQCVSLYPTPAKYAHMRAMDMLRETFQVPVGFSDHSLGIGLPTAAAARGACIIEKHLTLNRKLKGPDHSYALEPNDFKNMVSAIREVEEGLGRPVKKMLAQEKQYARRNSLWSAKFIRKGVSIQNDMVEVKRPATGVEPRYLNLVIGSKAKEDIKRGSPIVWEMLEATF